jgi:hypothetical protein
MIAEVKGHHRLKQAAVEKMIDGKGLVVDDMFPAILPLEHANGICRTGDCRGHGKIKERLV